LLGSLIASVKSARRKMEIIAESFTGAREAAIARYRYMCAKTERQPTEDNTVKEKQRTGRLLYRNPASTLTVSIK
jgi:hypothetical protein